MNNQPKKRNVIVWGTGSGFQKRKKALQTQYNIIAVTDNSKKSGDLDGIPRIAPSEIAAYPYDNIIICNIIYYESIKYQLIYDYGVNEETILWISGSEDADAQTIIFDSVQKYNELNKRTDFRITSENLYLISSDYHKEAGFPSPHYFAQDIWGARKVYASGVQKHYDIGSRLDGFLAHLLVFCPEVIYIDIRPLPVTIPHLCFRQGNATDLSDFADNSIKSLSSFHAIEHFGLGRYGDPLDPDACFKAMHSMARVLAPGGHLYFGIPIGPQDKLMFNAHRIFHPRTVLDTFASLDLVELAVLPGEACAEQVVAEADIDRVAMTLPDYSCGLFEFAKRCD